MPSDVKPNIYEKLLNVRQAVGYILKEGKKVNNQYFPVSYEGVVEQIAPELATQRLCLIPQAVYVHISPHKKVNDSGSEFNSGYCCEVMLEIEVVNIDNPDEKVRTRAPGFAWDTLDKCEGKALTKAQRHCLQRLFMLPSYEEKDAPTHKPVSVPSENYTPVSAEQVQILRDLCTTCGIGEEIVAKAADASFTSIDQIPAAKYAGILERLNKRAQQLAGASA